MPYEPFLLGVGVVFNLLICFSLTQIAYRAIVSDQRVMVCQYLSGTKTLTVVMVLYLDGRTRQSPIANVQRTLGRCPSTVLRVALGRALI